jgi:succinoglycan biosynthesis transport protein ExoP
VIPRLDGYVCREDWRLAGCLQILNRRKVALIGLTYVGILAAAVVTALQTKMYRATASLEFQAFNDSFLDLKDIYPTAAPSGEAAIYIQTQAEQLQHDALLQQVIEKLRLERYPEYRDPHGIVPRLREDIRIVPVRNSRIIQIVCDARSGPLAADISNTLAGAFVQQSVQDRQESARQTYQALLPQVEELQRTLRPSTALARRSTRGTEVNRRLYDAMLQQAYHAWFATRLPASNVRLAAPAEPPLTPHRPRVPGEAGTYLELPELGAIPQASQWPAFGIFVPSSANRRHRIDQSAREQGAELSESFRAAVASMLSAGRDGHHSRVIVVTSSQPTEGKTTVVSNLGIALADISKKVLLIDGDIRRPRLHKLFDEANSWGLSDVLREKNAIDKLPLDALAKKTQVPHLYLLPSGASSDNIFGLLYSGRMSRLLPLFREEFDYVLVDAPPCLEFADARIMARYAEELLLVVRANHTDRGIVQAAVQRLRLDGIPLLSVILNRWDPRPGDPYSYQTVQPRIQHDIS